MNPKHTEAILTRLPAILRSRVSFAQVADWSPQGIAAVDYRVNGPFSASFLVRVLSRPDGGVDSVELLPLVTTRA